MSFTLIFEINSRLMPIYSIILQYRIHITRRVVLIFFEETTATMHDIMSLYPL